MSMTLTLRDAAPGISLATVTGEIDLATSAELESGLLEAAEAADRLVVDVSKVTFIDSSGLHALDNARRFTLERGTRLVLAGASAQLVRVLSITALLDVFTLVPDLASALDGLAGQ